MLQRGRVPRLAGGFLLSGPKPSMNLVSTQDSVSNSTEMGFVELFLAHTSLGRCLFGRGTLCIAPQTQEERRPRSHRTEGLVTAGVWHDCVGFLVPWLLCRRATSPKPLSPLKKSGLCMAANICIQFGVRV